MYRLCLKPSLETTFASLHVFFFAITLLVSFSCFQYPNFAEKCLCILQCFSQHCQVVAVSLNKKSVIHTTLIASVFFFFLQKLLERVEFWSTGLNKNSFYFKIILVITPPGTAKSKINNTCYYTIPKRNNYYEPKLQFTMLVRPEMVIYHCE